MIRIYLSKTGVIDRIDYEFSMQLVFVLINRQKVCC